MDRRIEKTKTALYAAFMQLRAKKSIQKIKIAELCQTANINKTTFYAHYKDIYDLSEDVENQMLYKIISSIPKDKEYTFSKPANFTKELMLAFEQHDDEMAILFSNNDLGHLGICLEQTIKNTIFNKYPHLKDNAHMNILLSYCIYGALYANIRNRNLPFETILATVEKITSTLKPIMENN